MLKKPNFSDQYLLFLYNIHMKQCAMKNRNKPLLKLRYEYLEDFIRFHKYKKIVEIGSGSGLIIYYLFETCNDIIEEYVAIDPGPPLKKKYPKDFMKQYYMFVKSYYKLNFMQITANEANKKFQDGYFDLVYMDELAHLPKNKKKLYIENDIKEWLPKVRKGGIICGHDYDKVGLFQRDVYLTIEKIFPSGVNLTLENHIYGGMEEETDYIWWRYI